MTSTLPPQQVRTKYLKGSQGTSLVLKYRPHEAATLHSIIKRIRLKGDKAPSLSLIARRSLALYLDLLDSSTQAFDNEVRALEKLATPVSRRIPQEPLTPPPRDSATATQ